MPLSPSAPSIRDESFSETSETSETPFSETSLSEAFHQVRQLSAALCAPLTTEDYVVQSMADVSPPKWHLAHTTWFFETFLLIPHLPGYEVFHPQFGYLFNSYYEAVGDRHPRAERGLLTRPTVDDVYQYRAYVDQAMAELCATNSNLSALQELLTLGLHHEQQHQELLMTDIKHILASNPLHPAYRADLPQAPQPLTFSPSSQAGRQKWLDFEGGLHRIGHDGAAFTFNGFAFDNESPRHLVYVQDYQLAAQLVTCGEYLEFMEAGGYHKPEYWLSEGWSTIQEHQWRSPLYWECIDGEWFVMTLGGLRSLNPQEPVCHVSFFEADAFARWADKRLPTEAEWEIAAVQYPLQGNLLAQGYLHPVSRSPSQAFNPQFYGDVWEWTQSAYLPYPNFKSAAGAVGEYNGKFMCNQMVLRGGSCVTPPGHVRPTYRNFFPTAARWQFTGLRLAQSR
ncbi:MAG: ergothioneine biosynthesis protein EgtB [Thermosynechococcaceae cyanobacterium MS004]|nr:ergothioneine biosynthesis protein EgtB [Thermosynechococcaceae cyanobacterium MS004]